MMQEAKRFNVANCGRRFGKSKMSVRILSKVAIAGNPAGYFAPTYKLLEGTFKECLDCLEPMVKRKHDNQFIELITGGSIEFWSLDNPQAGRSRKYKTVIIDEAAFVKNLWEAWTQAIRATLTDLKGDAWFLSTPKGKNHFYRLHQLDGNNEQYKSFTMTSYDNPMINPKEIDDARYTLPEMIFKQEYLAEFVDGSALLFNNRVLKDSQPYGNAYAGIDLGRADDYSVLSIFNERGEQIYIERWRHTDWSAIVKNIAEGIRQNNVRSVLVEVNSIGDVIFELLEKELRNYCRVEPFTTTAQSKKEVVEQLIVANQNAEVTFCNAEWLDKELEMFSYEYNPKTRHIRYSAPSGFHDDGVMSTCIAYECYVKNKGGRYMVS